MGKYSIKQIPGIKYLSLALLSLILAALFRFIIIDLAFNEATIASNLQADIERELSKLDADAEKVLEELSQRTMVREMNPIETNYPYFIFQGGALEFWSAYNYVPNYYELDGILDVGLLRARNGYYLAKRINPPADDYRSTEIFFLVPVFWSPGIENQYLRSSFNPALIRSNYFTILEDPSVFNERNIFYNDTYLFSISFPAGFRGANPIFNILSLILSLFSLLFLVLFFQKVLQYFNRREHYWTGFFFLLIALSGFRIAMLYGNFPFSASQMGLFNPQNYASSWFNPSLGDLLLNVAALTWLALYLMKVFFKSSFFRFLKRRSTSWSIIFIFLLGIFSFISLLSVFHYAQNISAHSNWSLDITSSLNISYLRVTSFLILFLLGGIYFVTTHLFYRACQIKSRESRSFNQLFLLGGLAPSFLALIILPSGWPVTLIHSLYLIILLFSKVPELLGKRGYFSFSYILITCMAVSAAGSSGDFNYQHIQQSAEMQQLGEQLLMENDPLAEYMLNELSYKIEDDIFIRNRLLNPYLSNDVIEQKIRRTYILNDFDKYDVKIHLFDSRGFPLLENSVDLTFSQWLRTFALEEFKTDYMNIYLVPDQGLSFSRRYISYINLQSGDNFNLGYVVVELSRKRFFANTVYPELLVDVAVYDQNLERKYDFGIYKSGLLAQSGGIYSYPRYLFNTPFEHANTSESDIIVDKYRHFTFTGNEKVAVVSTPILPFRNWLANFSLQFLLLVFIIFLIIAIYNLKVVRKSTTVSYVSRIQLYLNLAFFIPLIVVSITTLSRINSVSREEITENYYKKAESATNNLSSAIDTYGVGNISQDELTENVFNLSRILESDINIFSIDGRLITTSQPSIYENYLLSRYINPRAKNIIVNEDRNRVILEESIGTLNFRTVYRPIRSFETGNIIGLLSMPFFESATDLESQQSSVLSNILITFTAIFIFFLVIAYLVSEVLTHPFRYIADKIKKTSLSSLNEPLEWKSDDEIGLMVAEYNRMLINLERNKEALAKTEKESAWREMAQQVAHEIKNPLTPMKLTLQQMQRVIALKDQDRLLNLDKQVKTLLTQIDNLSEIASSFSAFAQMPTPKAELFDIVVLLKETSRLFQNDPKVTLHEDIREKSMWVIADRKLFSRIFSNLIINAIQATKDDQKAEVTVLLKKLQNHKVIVSIKDNGSGIPEEIQDKIFLPSFSTKASGSGLGLAMAKHGVENAKGSIWFDSNSEWGTVFHIELPIARN